MHRVLFVTNHYPPDIGAASNRSRHVVHALRKQGLHVDVLTSRPVYPNPILYHFNKEWKEKNESTDGRVRYLFACSRGYKWFPLLFRLINQLIFFFLASFYVLRKGRSYGLVITSSPPFPVNAVGFLAKYVHHCKWVMEIRDLWPDSLHAVGKMSRSSFVFKLLKRVELLFYRKSDGIILLAPGMVSHLVNSGIRREKLSTVTNGIPEWVCKRKEDYTVVKPLTVRYIGNIGHAQDFEPLLEMAEQNNGIRFELIGEGLYKGQLVEEVNKRVLSNVHVKNGIVGKEQIIAAYLESDVGYIGLKSHDVFSHVIPSKLFEYGAIGIPILYFGPADSDCSAIIRTYGLGKIVSDPSEVSAELLKQVINDYRKDAKVQDFLSQYSWEAIGSSYYEFLSSRGCLHERKSVHDGVESFYN